MLRLSQQTADTYSHGFSAFMGERNKISAGLSLSASKCPPSVSPMFKGAHNQGLARHIPANITNGGFSIADIVVAA